MALKRQEFHRTRKGNLTVRDDRWSVLLDTATDRVSVEHWWAHVDPETGRPLLEDKHVYSLEEFAITELGQELQGKLRPAIDSIQKA
jgi:hypothetical protein